MRQLLGNDTDTPALPANLQSSDCVSTRQVPLGRAVCASEVQPISCSGIGRRCSTGEHIRQQLHAYKGVSAVSWSLLGNNRTHNPYEVGCEQARDVDLSA